MQNRSEWLDYRKQGIGGSDSAAILGLNPYMSNVQLWEIKTGRREQEDIGAKPYVKYGNDAEGPLRELFSLDFPKYKVSWKEWDAREHKEHSFLRGTLDGELLETETGRRGVLEIKTTSILQSMQYERWNNQVPQNYFVQILHYLLVTGFDFAVLKAQLKTVYGEDIRLNVRHYFFEREKLKKDLEILEKKVVDFWQNNVLKDIKPNLILPNI